MDITCSAEPCPIVLNSTCVFYEGDNLIYTGINNNDNLQTALQKIDQKFQDAGLGYIFSNGIEQLVPGGAVMLGGALNKNTTIGGLYNLAFAGTLEASALITTGGSSTDFVKGDGSLDPTNYQPAGNYISNLTGDVIANGPGSVNATLATVFGAPGTYGNSGSVPSITVDGKGRITNVTPIPINYPAQSLSFVGDVDGFGFTGSPVTLTLDTVNTDIYGSNNFLKFAVNGKGLITSATPVSGGDITTALGYVPVDDSIQLSINGVAQDLTANRSWSVGTVTSVGVTAGLGISASVSNPNTIPVINIVNTAPDQTVTLNAGYGISVTGSYPNFTITNDYPDLPEKVTSFSSGNLVPLFTTSVATPTTTPALSFALANAAANTVFAGPDGGAGTPTYRALVAADIPSLAYISSISVSAPLATTGGLTPTLSISQAGSSTDGYLSSTDWNTFNNKEDALGYTPVPDTRQLTINGTVYDLTADRTWSVGTVTSIATSAPLTGGTITNSGTLGITQASGGTDGYLSAADWSTFNGKQPAGSYITDLTGDATASGPGSVCLTLASVNLATGTFGSSTQVPVITVNNKGLVTCVTTDTISGSLEFIGDVTGTGSTGTCTTLTLATVNNDVYTSETLLNIAVNGKGLITSANPTTAGDICSTLGYTPEDVANKSTCTSLGSSNTLYPTQLAVKTYVDSATAGGIILQGDWNAATNSPDITGTTTTGWAWRVSVQGTTNLGGINDWHVGDLAVKSATGWVKIDNTENVTSVFGRFGTVIATTGDYLTCQVTECGDLYYTDARVRAAIGHTAPLTYCSTTGVFGISQSNATTDGYLSATDWTTFNDKQPLIACGTIGQYYRGDKTFQTLDTLAVPENTNLYFTDARARAAICASSGVAYNPSTGLITNSCPDQIVSLTGGGTTSVTGTYPNFTISSSDCFSGTVTCVAVSGTNIGVTGSPITSSGTIGLSLNAANVCSALGFSPYNSTNPAGYTTCTGTVTCVAASTSTTGVSITGSPITSSGTLGINVSTASSVCTGLLTAADWNTFNSHTSCSGTVTSVGLTSSTAGVSIACSPVTTSGTISLNIATASSLCTGLLTAADWNSFNSRTSCTGTVTCVNATGTNISVTGGPITTSGTLAISLSGANVCSALGYTPYNATNPNGYTTCIGTVTSAGIVATNINVCNSPVTTSGNICLNLTGANVCSALGFSPAPSSALSSYLPLAGGTMSGILCSTYNTSSNRANLSFDVSSSVLGNIHIQNGAGSTSGSANQAAITFMGSVSSNAQAGIYVLNDNSNGTSMGFATTNSYAVGPQLFMTASNNGVVNFPRANPTVQGNAVLHAGNFNSYAPTLTGGGASGTWSITATGNVASRAQSNWNDNTVINNVIGLMAWKNYGNAHVIFDASQGTSPSGGGVSQTNATNAWTATYPTLMGWNGSQTYGVRVDSARVADSAGSATTATYATNSTRLYATDNPYCYGCAAPYYMYMTYDGTRWLLQVSPATPSAVRVSYADSAGSVDFNNLTNKTGGTGTYQTSGDFRAPIFYDSNDTTYYADFNSTTSAIFRGSVGLNNTSPVNSAWGNATTTTQLSITGSNYGLINLRGDLNGARTFSMGVGDNTFYMCYDNTAGRHNIIVNSSGNVTAAVDFRAPIFYDSADTTYYVDPGSNGTRAAFLNGNVWISPKPESYGEGIAFLMPSQATWGGLRWLRAVGNYTGAWAFGYFGNESNDNIGFHSAGVNGWRLDHSWNMTVIGSVRAPIFYDSEDTSYYVDPNGTSNLLKLSGRTMAYNDMNPMSANSPYAARYNGSAQYRNGTMGYGTVDFNVILSNWGSGFIDTWSSPGNAPGGSTHYVGLQSFHYNFENSSQAYGFQMACAGEADNRFFWRSAWPNVRSWVEMIHSGNIGSQSVSYANSAGSATNSTNTSNISLTSLGNGSMNVSNGASAVYRNENGNGGNLNYAPVLHLGGGDTMWQIQGDYYNSSTLQWRAGYAGSWYAWRQILHSANYNSYSPTLTGGGASGTWGISISGNAANATSISNATGGSYTWTATNYFQSNQGGYSGSLASPPLQAYSTGNNSAYFSWHKSGVYAVNMGLDADNVLRIGGWSAAANRWQLDMSGNQTVAGTSTAVGFYESSDSRLKELIQDDYRAIGIQDIKPKLYIKNGKEEVGYYAQDLQSILSSAVTESSEGFLNLSYTQVHTAKIAYIEDEVDILKRRVSELEVKLQKYEA